MTNYPVINRYSYHTTLQTGEQTVSDCPHYLILYITHACMCQQKGWIPKYVNFVRCIKPGYGFDVILMSQLVTLRSGESHVEPLGDFMNLWESNIIYCKS